MSLQKMKTANLLRICLKAGKAVKGFDSAKEALERGKAFSVLTAMDASEKTLKEVSFFCKKYGAVHIRTEIFKEELGIMCGKQTAVIAVCDQGFTEGFLKIVTA